MGLRYKNDGKRRENNPQSINEEGTPSLKHAIIILYIILSGIHLYHSWKDDARRRAMTKPFLLLLLAIYYAFSTTDLSWALILALLTSWLGDVLLIPKGHMWFTMGGISFLFSHFLFIAVYTPSVDFAVVPIVFIVVMAAIYYGISLMIIRAVRKTTPKIMVAPMYMYLLANSTMNLFPSCGSSPWALSAAPWLMWVRFCSSFPIAPCSWSVITAIKT